VTAWLSQHAAALRSALRRLLGAPLNAALALFVIGLALTLPAGGWLLLDNLRLAADKAAGPQQISLFLTPEATPAAVDEIRTRLQAAAPGNWEFVPRDAALKRLQQTAGLGEIVASLPRNPLPDAFIVRPADTAPASMETMAATLTGWPKVAHVQLDSAWIRRFDALLRLGRLTVALLGGVFAAALVAATFNTIRLQILAHAAEIEVARLIGATEAWIRRPFAYFGALQGLLGGLLASLLLMAATRLLGPAVDELAVLYGSNFVLRGPDAELAGLLALAGACLGWLGAMLSVRSATR